MGLNISVYRSNLGDCTNDGMSSRANTLCLINVEGPSLPAPGIRAAWLESHRKGMLRIVPAVFSNGKWHKGEQWYMMGGNYGATSDSRFPDACRKLLNTEWYGAVAIHDRVE